MTDLPYRILVVDDQPQSATLAEAYLQALGCVVDTACNGSQALQAIDSTPPDLILLDAMMPGMDGFEVCRRLKANKTHAQIPIILLSALQSSEDRVNGIEAGANDFITKPFNRLELLARVRTLLRLKRLEEQERQHLRRTLERYMDSSVAQHMLAETRDAVGNVHRQEASILFADLRGFTAWSESQTPEVVAEVINRFLSHAVEAVFRHGGTVDKFIGDGLMALFGAPLPQPDHPRRAVAAALEIISEAANIAHPHLTEPLRVGCGVNSGEVVVGNIGSERRLDYTALGDVVNVARRLVDEAAGGQVLVGEVTWARLGQPEGQALGLKRMRNRRRPVRTFAVTGLG